MKIRAGFVGFGEVNTPREFIDNRCRAVETELRRRGVTLVTAAPVADDPAGSQAERAVKELQSGCFDALVVCIAGWIPSWAVIKVIENFRSLPILLWGLSGWNDGGRFVTTADQAGSTALRAVLEELGYRFRYLVNFRDAPPRCDEALEFLTAASAAAELRQAVIGMAGYRDMRLYGTMYDGLLLKRVLGLEIEHFNLAEVQTAMSLADDDAIAAARAHIRRHWQFVRPPQPATLDQSIRLALAFKRKLLERRYRAFSFCDVDGIKKLFRVAPAGAMTLLHDELAIPTVPENDAYGTATALLLQQLTGQLPFYLEFYEFSSRSALMGVPDYVPSAAVDGRVTILPNTFGNFGEGLLNVSKLKTGTVTLARLSVKDGRFRLHAAVAEATAPASWEEAGWAPPAPQLPSLEMNFAFPSDDFLAEVAGQHYIVCYGDRLGVLRQYCAIAGIDSVETR